MKAMLSFAAIQWLLGLSMLLLVAATLAELMWLVKRGSTNPTHAVAFILVTDYVGLFIVTSVSFALLIGLGMMVSAPSDEEAAVLEWTFKAVGWFAIAFLVIVIPLGLVLLAMMVLVLVRSIDW